MMNSNFFKNTHDRFEQIGDGLGIFGAALFVHNFPFSSDFVSNVLVLNQSKYFYELPDVDIIILDFFFQKCHSGIDWNVTSQGENTVALYCKKR